VSARLPHDLINAIDAWADQNNISSRQEAIRRLTELGLRANQKRK
jgi:metal-responsive CopG/Arc/MetJ family transcriptional regulator